MIRISVIMPVYNVEEYLGDALDSLVNQTMIDDIEVIMIDDGSTDSSRYIIDQYAEEYDNFYAYHKKREGQAIARNFGLDLARGEYIHFMDADDYIPPKAYENLYYFNPYNDFIVGNVLKFGEYNVWENILFKKAFSDFNDNVKSFTLNEVPNILWDSFTYNKLFKKDFLDRNNIRFINRNIYYEDLLFSMQAYILADSIGFSRNIFYFWRSRKDKSSVTQKIDDVKNFNDRIEILKIQNYLMKKYELSQNIIDLVYTKWLTHDLRTSIKKIREYPGKYYSKILSETNELLNLIPDNLKDNLNFYLKILYKMVENNDLFSLLEFVHLEDDLKQNPQLSSNIHQQYLPLIELDCDFKKEEYEVRVSDVFNDDKKLYLEFSENLDFALISCPHKTTASLISYGGDIPLKVRNNQIIIPLDLIKDKNHLKIQLNYKTNDFNKSSLLKNFVRKSIRYADYDIDLGIGINNILYLDVRRKTDNQIIVNDIIFDNDEFIFKCESLKNVGSLSLTNYVTYRQINYQARYAKNSSNFIIVIPVEDLANSVINKWELNCPESYNSIKLDSEVKFVFKNSELIFRNKRNKIYIFKRFHNAFKDELDVIKSNNEKLINSNNKLSSENIKLKKDLYAFKSRKTVKMADDIKKIFK